MADLLEEIDVAEGTCSVAKCDGRAYCKSYCDKHYRKFRMYGDPLVGRSNTRLSGTPEQRFWPKVNKNGPVQPHRPDLGPYWLWTTTASTPNGYPQFRSGNRMVLAYRFAYENVVGPIPDGHQLDHLCHNQHPACPGGSECPHRKCVNPGHLEPLATTKENCERRTGMLYADRLCRKKLHPMTEDNVRVTRTGIRVCKKCTPRSRGGGVQSVCANGHTRTTANTYTYPSGQVSCRTCTRDAMRAHRDKSRSKSA